MNRNWKALAVAVPLMLGALPLPTATAVVQHKCLGEDATIVGTRGRDRIRGTSGADVIVGLAGADQISGLGGPEDVLCGNEGPDIIYMDTKAGFESCAGTDANISGGKGDDRIYGGGQSFGAQGDLGDDFIDGCSLAGLRVVTYWSSQTPVQIKLWNDFASGQGSDTLKNINAAYGSQFDDTIVGTNRSYAREFLGGMEGNDMIDGLGGPDEMWGGFGDDSLYAKDGQAGNDKLHGDDGKDICQADESDEIDTCEF